MNHASKKQSNRLTRRQFLGQASCSAVTATPLLSTLFNLQLANNLVASPGEDYRALVCIFLAGGMDSFNLLVPTQDDAYAGYAAARSNLAIPKSDLLALNGAQGAGAFGVHPATPALQSLYQSGRLAFVSNVGTLVEPTTLQAFRKNTAKLPLGLFSHSDQIMHWQTSVPDQRSPNGWAGRMADLLHARNTGGRVSMNISLSGTNMFQSGSQSMSYEIGSDANGSVTLGRFGNHETVGELGRLAVKSLMDVEYKNLFQQTFAGINRRSIDAADHFGRSVAGVQLSTAFSQSDLSRSLNMIARTIGARKALGMKRQTFFVMFGGWDHHEELLNTQAPMLNVLSQAMSEFDQAMTELQLSDQVTTFTASDFARTLSSNGRGSDHAWGGNHMVMGGAVKGGRVYGDYPDLAPDNALDTGRGRLIPTLSTDEYFAELAQWFGVLTSDLGALFPNLHRFHAVGQGSPLGIL